MKVKYDILYTNGKSETLTKGALSIEQVQMEALRLSQQPGVLKVTYSIQEELINMDALENLYEKVIKYTDVSAAYKLLDPEILHQTLKDYERNK